MDPLANDLARIAGIGIIGTAALDLWLLLLARLGIRTLDFGLLGRWVGHLARGRLRHDAIGRSPALPRELAIGWLAHYAVGIAFAILLVAAAGAGWARNPTWLPGLVFGLATAAVPLFVMQPAMGLGIASSKTPAPLRNTLRSLANHAVFGSGLYVAAAAVAWATR